MQHTMRVAKISIFLQTKKRNRLFCVTNAQTLCYKKQIYLKMQISIKNIINTMMKIIFINKTIKNI